VLAVRLYSGPGHHVINHFMREMSKLDQSMRICFTHAGMVTYAATAKALSSAIRKLARVNPAASGGCNWRGLRGVLPDTFFTPDVFGMIFATDGGFMSTSLNRETPVRYMSCDVSNVLWQLMTSGEDERGFHCGANISVLSQFAAEEEELYPPLTMLRVLARTRQDTLPSGAKTRFPGQATSGGPSEKGTTRAHGIVKPLMKQISSSVLQFASVGSFIATDPEPHAEGEGAASSSRRPSASWEELLLPSKLLGPTTDQAVQTEAAKKWLARTNSATRDFVDEHTPWQAAFRFEEGKSFVQVIVEPSFV